MVQLILIQVQGFGEEPCEVDHNPRKRPAGLHENPARRIRFENQQAGQWREGKGAYALALALVVFAYFLLNRSTRPSASTIFWVPVKKG